MANLIRPVKDLLMCVSEIFLNVGFPKIKTLCVVAISPGVDAMIPTWVELKRAKSLFRTKLVW